METRVLAFCIASGQSRFSTLRVGRCAGPMGSRLKRGGSTNRRNRTGSSFDHGRQLPRMNLKPTLDPFAGPKILPRALPATLEGKGVSILWFRNDLRLRDNAALALANTAGIMLPAYVFDVTQFGEEHLSPYGFQRTGPFQAHFLKQAVLDVRNCLMLRGSDMLVRTGHPIEILEEVVEKLKANSIDTIHFVAHKETTFEEVRFEKEVEIKLKQLAESHGLNIDVHWVWGATMHHIDDIPFNAGGPRVPATFTEYRRWMESEDGPDVRDEVEVPVQLTKYPFGLMLKNDIPSLGEDLGVVGVGEPNDFPFPDHRAVMGFVGGPSAGEERINEYIWENYGLEVYKETRNGSGTKDFSSKFSPWLALGCISPRTVYWQVKKFEMNVAANESTYWMIFELLTRDYFHWVAASVGTKLFALNGYSGRSENEKSIWRLADKQITPELRERLLKWIEGATGAPFIDASMRELKLTGFMSNRGRQNVASFLIHDLEFPDWRAGAEYFESMLIDHDVASNWCNWAYIAGVGSDPRGGRKFNVIKQSYDYDADGWFIRGWCHELAKVPAPYVHEPHFMSEQQWEEYKMEEGVSYPQPIVKLPRAPKKSSVKK